MQYTALHWVAVNGHINIGRLLLDGGADVEAVNDRKWASMYTRTFTSPFCLHNGVLALNLFMDGAGNATPLFLAAQNGQLAVAKLLIEYNANPDATVHVSYAIEFHAEIRRRRTETKLQREV